MTEDLDWARELFDGTRGAGEPAWTADPTALARAGNRRRRLRTAGAGGGLAGVVAVTVAVALGLGAGTTDAGSQPGPGGGWGNRPLSDVFKYVGYFGGVGADQSGKSYVPAPAAEDVAAVLGHVDPSLTHFAGNDGHGDSPRIVSAGDAHAKQNKAITTSAIWTDDTPRQSGSLNFGLASSVGWAQALGVAAIDVGSLAAPCNLPFGVVQPNAGSSTTSAPRTQWSSCTVSHLQDGSTIGSASARMGKGTAIVVSRQFPDGELFTVVAQDFSTPTWKNGVPDPATVVQPTPWTQQSLAAALADPAVRSPLSEIPPPNSDGRLVQPADLGKGWVYDTSVADQGTAGQFMITNGCAADLNVALAGPGSEAHYWGALPNGVSGTAYAGEYPLPAGSGAKTMASARAAAQGGCKNGPVDYAKDTVMPLPAGIGDEAFAESEPDLGTVGITVRVGDTILRTDLSNTNHVRDQTWTDKKPLDLTSSADRQWLADIARSMVSRYTAGARH